MDNLIYIYSLDCPITDNIRYIGQSKNTDNRYKWHIYDLNSKKTYKTNWIKSLLKKGLRPKLNIIDAVSLEEAPFWERHYISLYKSWGFKLTNSSEGGDGKFGSKLSKETKDKIYKTKLKNGSHISGAKKGAETRRRLGIHLIAAKKIREKNIENGSFKRNSERMKMNNPAKKIAKPILQYSMDGKFIKEWESASVLEKETGFFRENIGKCCKKHNLTQYGFRWRYKNGEIKYKIDNFYSYKVVRFDLNGNLIDEWNSPKDAGEKLNINGNNINFACRNEFATYKGYKWKYKKDLTI